MTGWDLMAGYFLFRECWDLKSIRTEEYSHRFLMGLIIEAVANDGDYVQEGCGSHQDQRSIDSD